MKIKYKYVYNFLVSSLKLFCSGALTLTNFTTASKRVERNELGTDFNNKIYV